MMDPEVSGGIIFPHLSAEPFGQNHPNPFNPSSTIWYELPEASNVTLVIYDLLGKEIRKWDMRRQAGHSHIVWDGRNAQGEAVPAGVYIYTLRAKSRESDQRFNGTMKMVLLK